MDGTATVAEIAARQYDLDASVGITIKSFDAARGAEHTDTQHTQRQNTRVRQPMSDRAGSTISAFVSIVEVLGL